MTSLHPREIDVSIDETLGRDGDPCAPTEEWLRMAVDCALQVALPSDQSGQVSLLLTDDATVRELNRQYRGLDEVTDVLSFSTTHAGHWEGDIPDADGIDWNTGPAEGFVFPLDQTPPLGEVIISYPQACRQAQDSHQPVKRELALLVIHGVLHLVGHDHLEPDETAEMQAREQAALETLFSMETNGKTNS